MELNTEAIAGFKKIYFDVYGKQLSDNQAVEYGIRVINLVKTIYKNNSPLIIVDNTGKKINNKNALRKAGGVF